MSAKPGKTSGRWLRRLEIAIGTIATSVSGISFVGMFLVVLAAIVMRFILQIPFFWGEEAARYFMLLGVYFGMSVAVREKAHLGVDIFTNLLPARIGRIVRFIALVLTTLTYLVVTKVCWDFTARMKRGTQISPAMSIPMWIVYSVLLIGFGLCVFECLFELWREYIAPPDSMDEADKEEDEEEVRLV